MQEASHGTSPECLVRCLFFFSFFFQTTHIVATTDPEAEVIALSPKTLMAKNRFVCEICNKGFQRDQNLQLHRRGPKQTTLDFLGLGRAVGNGSSNPGGGLSALFGTAGEFSGKDIGRTSS
ncbi:unnamed protein product [Brassica rapa]|uniref:C2H2-type domain-containing protein n=1 Tax=Brassica campestris TaxID=3711 RepID=A0A8D9M3Z4_BRACM|nr:unnamed protein product [Brassica rapa]